MPLSFYTILAAQFFSALADNALLPAAIALLIELSAPKSYVPILQVFFVVSYIAFAPFVGALADAFPKGRVMSTSNAVKFIGCLTMLFGAHPLVAYAIVGFGAAAYSPAKYGILTEYLPPSQLVKANSWMEGSTVAAIVLGAILSGWLVTSDIVDAAIFHLSPGEGLSAPQFAIAITTFLYLAAAITNLYIPHVPRDHKLPKKDPLYVLHDFWHAFKLLWRDPQGQVSLAVTTLFWGAGATLRLVVITWAMLTLQYDFEEATRLTALVAVGIAVGAVFAARYIRLEHAIKALPAGILMGMLVVAMIYVSDWRIGWILLFLIGALSGFFVVPLNALLQHRGHLLMGAGHSIAVQNFNENIGILVLLGAYTLMVKADMQINSVVVIFGLFISLSMSVIYRRYNSQPFEDRTLIRKAGP